LLAAIKAAGEIGKETIVDPRLYASCGPHLFIGGPSLSMPGLYAGVGYSDRAHSQDEFITVEGIRDAEKWTAAFYSNFLTHKALHD
jgi:hypothetical protein